MLEFEDGKLLAPLPIRWTPELPKIDPSELRFSLQMPVPAVYPSTKGSGLLSSDDFCLAWNACFWGQFISETCQFPLNAQSVDPILESPAPVFRIRKVAFSPEVERYSASVRKAKIARFKAKMRRYRSKVTFSRYYLGRSRSAMFKPRLNGKFMKTTVA